MLRRQTQTSDRNRSGTIVVLAAIGIVTAIGFCAFVVDIGMLTVTKAQMQSAADSAAHAAAMEIARAFGPGAELSSEMAEVVARDRAVEMVSLFRTGDVVSTVADPSRDVRLGRRTWDESAGAWVDEWGVTPYNMVEVTVYRTEARTTGLPATFAQIFSHESFDLKAVSVAALHPGAGFYLPPDSDETTINILPIAVDLGSWNALLAQHYDDVDGGYGDNYAWTQQTGVYSHGDGIPEINIYPDLNSDKAPGNRGTVDLGSAKNSTNDLKRQIVYGLNSSDLSFFPNNRIEFNSSGALYLNGDTGISAGIENSLESIIGQVRAIPIFIEVTGQGNNAVYTIVQFVGVRILDVRLSGGPSRRHLTVQPAVYSSEYVIRDSIDINVDSILSQPLIIR